MVNQYSMLHGNTFPGARLKYCLASPGILLMLVKQPEQDILLGQSLERQAQVCRFRQAASLKFGTSLFFTASTEGCKLEKKQANKSNGTKCLLYWSTALLMQHLS